MNTLLLSALKRIDGVLRRWDAKIYYIGRTYDLPYGYNFYDKSYRVCYTINAVDEVQFDIGPDIEYIDERTLSKPFIHEMTLGTREPDKKAYAILEDMRSVFRELSIKWCRNGDLYIGGVRQMNIGFYLRRPELKEARNTLRDATQSAVDILFALAELFKKNDATIDWGTDIWPGGGHGGPVEDTPMYLALIYIVRGPSKHSFVLILVRSIITT